MPVVQRVFYTSSTGTFVESSFRSSNPKRAVLKGEGTFTDDSGATVTGAITVTFPFGPQNLEYGNYEADFSQIERPYLKPLLVYKNQQLRTVTFTAVIANKESGGTTSIAQILRDLEKISSYGLRCKFTYGLVALDYSVALTKFSYTVKYRDADGEPVRAEASIQLTEMPVITQEVTLLQAVYRTPAVTPAPIAPTSGYTDNTYYPPYQPPPDPDYDPTSNLTIYPTPPPPEGEQILPW